MNQVFLIGRLVADAEMKHTQAGIPLTTFRLAVNSPYKDKSGNWQEDTVFIDVTTWGNLADKTVQLSKGDRVFVSGRLKMEEWESNGQKRLKISVTAWKVEKLAGEEKSGEAIQQEIDF